MSLTPEQRDALERVCQDSVECSVAEVLAYPDGSQNTDDLKIVIRALEAAEQRAERAEVDAERLAEALELVRNAPVTAVEEGYPLKEWAHACETADAALRAYEERKA